MRPTRAESEGGCDCMGGTVSKAVSPGAGGCAARGRRGVCQGADQRETLW